MSLVKTYKPAHDDEVARSESVRQSAMVAGVSQATAKAADIAHYRACVASALLNGTNPAVFRFALWELGTNGS